MVIKLIHVLKLTALDIYLSVFAPTLLFVQLFESCVIPHDIWIRFFSYLYILFYHRGNNLFVEKLFRMKLSCTLFLIKKKGTVVKKTSVIILVCKEKQHCCKNVFHNFSMYFIYLWKKAASVNKMSVVIFVCKDKQLCCKNSFYLLVINENGNEHIMKSFKKYFK